MASDGEISCTNDPNFAVIYSFLKVFGKLYGLEIPSIAKLQQLVENTEEVPEALKELHLRLLRRAQKSVQSGRWERCLIKFCHQQGHHQEAWEIERFSYKKASTEVKLKTLKILLEYQFTCHAKFKAAVNALSCKELRLDPIGRDKNGCVYWLQVDDDANLCLYKEDQDEETWQLIARNREELVNVISKLKSGEEICPTSVSNTNEDSNSTEIPPATEVAEKTNTQPEEENEEFLSPESESEHDDDESKSNKKSPPSKPDSNKNEEKIEDNGTVETSEKSEDTKIEAEQKEEHLKVKEDSNLEDQKIEEHSEKSIAQKSEKVEDSDNQNSDVKEDKAEEKLDEVAEKPAISTDCQKSPEPEKIPDIPSKEETSEIKDSNDVGEAIEEPVMVVTGEGSGADCDSYFIGEEICEPVMYFYGEGCGYDNDTGNPEVLEEANSKQRNSDEENDNEECVNGEHSNSVNDISNSSKSKLGKNVKLKSTLPAVNKRSLKKQSNDNTEVLKSDSKKHCIRKPNRSDSLRSNSSNNEKDLKRESSINDKTTDSDSPNKNNIKKSRGKVKKKPDMSRKLKLNQKKELSPTSDADNCNDNKTSIIEKRKSSVSSDQDGVDHTENEKEGSPDKETKVEDDLPPKKLRLEPAPKDIDVSHSKEKDTVDKVNKDEAKSENNENNDNLNTEHLEKDPIAMRKKIKANKGKFKRKKILQNKVDNSDVDKSNNKTEEKSKSKPLKRSLLDATNSDKSKSESQSESEDDMPITSGKRLKIKPKKIITTSRKKVEAKLLEKKSSDDSEEETLYSIAGKKTGKKVLKKKPKGKEKGKTKVQSDDSDPTPVRQSRRIAQQKIKEEADRRHLEEVALRELKMIHKKGKSKDDEDEWRASGSSSGSPVRRRPAAKWRAQDSSEPDSESERDELSDRPEPDLEFGKSDHEFSPESDLETGEPSEPLKRARTLQEGADDGFCKHCGSGEQPEWILLCDQCDAGYHASCLKPMLFLVPEGDWFCPPCNHAMLISSLEGELVKYDELLVTVEAERARARELELQNKPPSVKSEEKEESDSGSSGWSSSSSSGAVYRLRARRQLPVSYRAQEYDRLISSAIKEEYVEPTTSAGNQGRGKDISTIIEAAEEEKLKAQREEAIAQGKPIVEIRKKKKQRRKQRKLNSLEVVSEDDDETDEDFKDTGMESSSEDISSSAERDSQDSCSSDSRPIRRAQRTDKKDRPKLRESSPEVKKKKGEFAGSSSESSGAKEWPPKNKLKSKSRQRREKRSRRDKRDKARSAHKKARGLQQYDALGNVVRARVTFGALSDDSPNDWSPKHRTRQKKINYTEMPNTESEDEMHKGSGKHMPDSSDEFKVTSSDATSESDAEARRARADDPRQKTLSDLIKTAVVPLEKLPDDVTKAKEEELQAHLNAAAAGAERPARGKGSRGGRGSRGPRGRGRGAPGADAALARLVGVKIKDLGQEPIKPNQLEREKKRQEREAKLAEKEAKRMERIQKKEEKEKLKEQKAKEREEKRLAKLALQESKRMKKEKPEYPVSGPVGYSVRPDMRMMYPGVAKHPDYPAPEQQRFPAQPRLQVRAELRGVPVAGPMSAVENMREGTLSVAGSPQPFKPVGEEPSVITRMPHMPHMSHMLNQYRGPMMYPGGNSPYGPRPQNMMYMHHPGLPTQRPQYPQQYYGLRGLPPGYRLPEPAPGANHSPGHLALGPRLLGTPGSSHGPHGPHGASHGPPGSSHGPPGSSHGPPGSSHGPHGLPGSSHGPPGSSHGPHGPPGSSHGPHGPPGSSHGPHGPPGSSHGPPGSSHGPPGSSHGPPGSSHGPPGSSHGQPGSSHGPHGPPGSSHGPPGAHGPPGSSHGPPGSSHGPPGSSHGPPGLHGPPGSSHGPPGSSHGPPGLHGPPGASHGPSGPSHGPPGLHGPPGSSHGPPGSHGPHGPPHGPQSTAHGPPGPPGSSHGPPGSSHGPPGSSHGPPGLPHGPPRPGSHGPPVSSHGPMLGPPGSPHPSALHGLLRAGPPVQLQGPRPLKPTGPPGVPGAPGVLGHPPHMPGAPHPAPPSSASPVALPPGPSPNPTTPPAKELPIKIKAEVKTEPEYHSPVQSPPRASPEPPRHPKIKHTDNKERRPRYPLGPYAPQYGPYGPYAPAPEPLLLPRGPAPLQRLPGLPPAPAERPPFPRRAPSPPPYYGSPPRAAPPAAPPAGPERVKAEPPAEGSVFGGLVSYFSSQREDELDA